MPPDWFHLVGLLHDLGKVLALFGEPQVSGTVERGHTGVRGIPLARDPSLGTPSRASGTPVAPLCSGPWWGTLSRWAARCRGPWSSGTPPSTTTPTPETPCTGEAGPPGQAAVGCCAPQPVSQLGKGLGGWRGVQPQAPDPTPSPAPSTGCTSLTAAWRTFSCPGDTMVRAGGVRLGSPPWGRVLCPQTGHRCTWGGCTPPRPPLLGDSELEAFAWDRGGGVLQLLGHPSCMGGGPAPATRAHPRTSPPLSPEYMYQVMKFNNFALPKEVRAGGR